MAFHWLNQARYDIESRDGVIRADIGGNALVRTRIKTVKPGDVLFSFTGKGLGAILVAEENPVTVGEICTVKCYYDELDRPVALPNVIAALSGQLSERYSPINSLGKRNQGYLYPLGVAAAEILLGLAGREVEETVLEEAGNGPARRVMMSSNKIIRKMSVPQYVKQLYGSVCQVCNTPVVTLSGPYAEGAHIIPLGAPHDGPDQCSNVLCLCPNHHVMFDTYSFSVADNGDLIGLHGKLHQVDAHLISAESLQWHREQHLMLTKRNE